MEFVIDDIDQVLIKCNKLENENEELKSQYFEMANIFQWRMFWKMSELSDMKRKNTELQKRIDILEQPRDVKQ